MSLVLASSSATRIALLREAGVDVVSKSPNVDEAALKLSLLASGATPRDVADALAEAKAVKVSIKTEGLVIGADSTLDLDGRLYDKPQNLGEAREHLLAFRGKSHKLHSAAVIAEAGAPVWRSVSTATLHVRPFSDAFLDNYIAAEGDALLTTVGCYRLEGLGRATLQHDRRRLLRHPGAAPAANPGLPAVERRRAIVTGARITASGVVAGVVGRPIGHSLSPLLHNSWLDATGLDAVYVAFSPAEDRFAAFVEGLRGGVIRGLNVTLPFKEKALAVADEASSLAHAAGAANLLLFHGDGRIEARNTDGEGLLYAFARQAPALRLTDGAVAIIGAGGAAKGAVASLSAAGRHRYTCHQSHPIQGAGFG